MTVTSIHKEEQAAKDTTIYHTHELILNHCGNPSHGLRSEKNIKMHHAQSILPSFLFLLTGEGEMSSYSLKPLASKNLSLSQWMWNNIHKESRLLLAATYSPDTSCKSPYIVAYFT